ncbi:MAG: type VI secretion system baseplate subunit TssK [Deltaproteobacteria bacterium]|jgi:type VI secretion system protein ImpJ|nr:type VI secretion system baseplate subunit TssK [Deltaproteobacteria bacterium]
MIHTRMIFWREGSGLEPHHFQLMEILARSEREAAASGLSPWPWGFASLSFDKDALERGVLEIREMDLALPGGMRLTVPGNAVIAPVRIPEPERPGGNAGRGPGSAGDPSGTELSGGGGPVVTGPGTGTEPSGTELSGEGGDSGVTGLGTGTELSGEGDPGVTGPESGGELSGEGGPVVTGPESGGELSGFSLSVWGGDSGVTGPESGEELSGTELSGEGGDPGVTDSRSGTEPYGTEPCGTEHSWTELSGGAPGTVRDDARVPGAGRAVDGAEDGTVTAWIAAPLFSHVGPNAWETPFEISGERAARLRAAEAALGGEPLRYPRYRELAEAGLRGRAGDGPRDAREDDPLALAAALQVPPALPGDFPSSGTEPGEAGRGWPGPDRRTWGGAAGPGRQGGEVPSGGYGERGARLMTGYREPRPVADMLAGQGQAWVNTLAYTPGLVAGRPGLDERGCVMLPVARLRRDARGWVRVPFAPPAVKLFQDGFLRETALDVLELLRAKARELEEFKLPASRGRAGPGAADPAGRALAVALGIVLRHIARLHQMLAAPSAHPYSVFAEICELVSELGLFSRGGGHAPPAWDHADPGPAYLAARAAVSGLLEEVSPGPELNLMFRRDGGSFVCEIPRLADGVFGFWLAARTGLAAEDAKAALSAGARLAPPARTGELLAAGLPGVGLTPVREAPAGLHRRQDTVYFQIRTRDPLWEEALSGGRLEVSWEGAPAEAQLMLVGVRS